MDGAPDLVVTADDLDSVRVAVHVGPERAPWRRKSGQKAPHWNHRTTSSRKSADSMLPDPKPPMSVVQYTIPDITMFSPALNLQHQPRRPHHTTGYATTVRGKAVQSEAHA